jgi:uncharacterized repeat protein (TIGR03803 family)
MSNINHSRCNRRVLTLLSAVLALLVVTTRPAMSQTEHILYSFVGTPDGANPWATLTRGPKGNFYGTTNTGGVYGAGTVFEITAAGEEKILYSFTGGADGGDPQTGLILDAEGNLYGTTPSNVFEVMPNGTEKVLHTFQGASDGADCEASLVRDTQGNLYGITMYGGAFGAGTVFEVTASGTEKILYSFTGGADGGYPWGGLVRAGGALYGTTTSGGTGYGTVFKLAANGKETVLHTFAGGADGWGPEGNLLRDSSGNFYGTTFNGGTGVSACLLGCGTVYEVSSTGVKTVLYNFMGGTDAAHPTSGLIRDASGNLYGATPYGGGTGCGGEGCGTVFAISSAGEETMLYSLPGGSDGANAVGGVIRDSKGDLYGTTFYGGSANCPGGGCGIVFKLTP